MTAFAFSPAASLAGSDGMLQSLDATEALRRANRR